jgi:phosphoribosyl-AMP cyclohydrolase
MAEESVQLDFSKADGLVVAVTVDADTGEVLMVATMNEEAFRRTLQDRQAVYWSRSRQTLWRKGESSGNVQRVKEIRVDCDQDAVLLRVEQSGPACHAGYRSCFYRTVEADGSLSINAQRVRDPRTMYREKP